jgi:hypothetical protein
MPIDMIYKDELIKEILDTLDDYLTAQICGSEDAWLYMESLHVHMKKYKELTRYERPH